MIEKALATASVEPEIDNTRSCMPGMTLLTPALTPVLSLRSATFLPPLPMIMPAVEEREIRKRCNCYKPTFFGGYECSQRD